jgi:hypothetical protein
MRAIIVKLGIIGGTVLFLLFLNMLLYANVEAKEVRPIRAPIQGIWISTKEIKGLPMKGKAWENLKMVADIPCMFPNISNQMDNIDVQTMAKAIVYVRTNEMIYKDEVITNIFYAMGTERGARTLALGKNVLGYIIAADLVGLPPQKDAKFKFWLKKLLVKKFRDGRTLISTQEERPNNWGTYAGAVRAAIARYLNDAKELQRTAQVFKGYLGDRKAYANFKYKHVGWWQANPLKPVGINPKGATKEGHNIDGVLPDDQRRSGPFKWPPPKENYVYTGLQGVLAEAVILYRAGYDVWNWQDKAILRAFNWLYFVCHYPAKGDDTWEPYLINYYYGTHFPTIVPSKPGKNVGWTDWTHAPLKKAAATDGGITN